MAQPQTHEATRLPQARGQGGDDTAFEQINSTCDSVEKGHAA